MIIVKSMKDKSKYLSSWNKSQEEKTRRRKRIVKLSRRVKAIKKRTGKGAKLW